MGILLSYSIVFCIQDKDGLFWFFIRVIVGGLLLLMGIFLLFDAIFTKEIILYPRKISKIWYWGIKKDVFFESAKFGSMKTPLLSSKRFYPFWYSDYFTPILGVFYDETLARGKDINLMNKYLAEISGRNLSVFEDESNFSTRSVSLKSFLKRD